MERDQRQGAGLRANAAPVKARYQRFELKLASGQLDDSQRERAISSRQGALAELEALDRVSKEQRQGDAAGRDGESEGMANAAVMYSEGWWLERGRVRNDPVVTEELDRWWSRQRRRTA